MLNVQSVSTSDFIPGIIPRNPADGLSSYGRISGNVTEIPRESEAILRDLLQKNMYKKWWHESPK